jgi:hypothetical protein
MKYLPFILVIFLSLQLSGQTKRYVRAGANGNGSSWANASGDLQLMINQSNSTLLTGDTILVAGGIYFPNRRIDNLNAVTPNDRVNSFSIKSNIKILGGFAPNGSGTRDLVLYETILSGNLGDIDSVADNAYHVVFARGVDTATLLDGFTIRDGNADAYASFTSVFGSNIMNYAGGGVYATGARMTFRNIIVKNNRTINSGVGGGFFNNEAPVIIDRSVIENNFSGEGGGLFNTFSSNIKMTNSRICGNTASLASGAQNSYSSPHYANVLVAGNLALSPFNSGAALTFESSSSGSITNLTIAGNKGRGLYLNSAGINIHNTIIYGNEKNLFIGYNDPYFRYCLVQLHTPYNGQNNLSPAANPHFAGPKSYTEAPFTDGDFRLLGISPAINAGNSHYLSPGQIPDLGALQFDLDHNPRITGASIDMGAYEFGSTCATLHKVWHVDASVGNSGDGTSWAQAFKTLGEALHKSSICGNPDSILVAEGTYFPDRPANNQIKTEPNNRANSFSMLPKVKLLGGYPKGGGNRDPVKHLTILSGDLGTTGVANDNAYHVVIAAGKMGDALLDGFVIEMGNANEYGINSLVNGADVVSSDGGGIYNANSNIRLNNLIIKSNKAMNGGGISNFSSVSVLSNLDIRGNTATFSGGGIYNNYTAPLIINCNISGNLANYGGGITNGGQAKPIFINVTITGNRGTTRGGAIENISTSNITIHNSIITENSSGIFNDPGYPGYTEKSTTSATYSLIQGINADSALHNPDGTTDPKFIEPVDFQLAPSLLGNFRLQEESEVINKGNSGLYAPGQTPDISNLITDLAGKPRLTGKAVDLGAYESAYVNSEALCIESVVLLSAGVQGTNYEWQVDEGSGYAPVTDGEVYSGSATEILTIKNIPGTWYGNKYRCAINGGQQYGKVYTIRFRNEWIGIANGNWHDPANWSCGRVPDANTDVIINSGTVVLSNDTVIRSLTVKPGAQISVTGQAKLTVTH